MPMSLIPRNVTTAVSTAAVKKDKSTVVAFAGAINTTTGPATASVNMSALATGHKNPGIITAPLTNAQIAGIADWSIPGGKVEPAVARSRSCTFKPLSAGVFACMSAGNYVIMRHTGTLSGVANTVLKSGGADFGNRVPVARTEVYRKAQTAQLLFKANVPNRETTYLQVVYTVGAVTYNADKGSRTTRALPGQLIYLETGKTPKQDNYKAKND